MKFSNCTRIALVAIAAASPLAAHADGDGGDNDMTPRYGDSWAALEAHTTAPVPSVATPQDRAKADAAWARVHATLREDVDRMRSLVHGTDPDAAHG